MRWIHFALSGAAVLCLSAAAFADSIQGSYVEARTVARAVQGGAAPGEAQLRRAVIAWQIRQGEYDREKLDGQTVIAVVTAEPSPGGEIGQTKTVFFVDNRTTPAQEKALVHLAKDLGSAAIHDSGQVIRSKQDVRIAEGCGCGAAVVECQLVKFRTRRHNDADPPFERGVKFDKPLSDVFSCTESVTTEYSFADGPAGGEANTVIAFTGSFSR
jgi:hypothetical protein